MYNSPIVMQFCYCCIGLLLLSEVVLMNLRHVFRPKQPKLAAITDSHHVVHLYQQLGNEDSPSQEDSALADLNARKRICRHITKSRYFFWKGLDSIEMDEKIYQELSSSPYPSYTALLHQIYSPPQNLSEKLRYSYGYTNEYAMREFHIKSDYSGEFRLKEHVFVCLLRRCISETVVPVYVSKEYNVFAGRQPYMAGRFLFGVHGFHRHEMQLVEYPANVLRSRGPVLELYYLKRRRQRQPAVSSDLDPICALVTTDMRNNQYHRLCVQVLTSVYFDEKIEYPRKFSSVECNEREITFRSAKARKRAASQPYREFMIRCEAYIKDSLDNVSVYVSRAYKKNEVFVFRVDDEAAEETSRKIYLENLSDNIGVVVEPVE